MITFCYLNVQYWLCEKTKICPLEKPYESPAFVKWNLHVLEKKLQSFNLGSLNQNHVSQNKSLFNILKILIFSFFSVSYN